jgi:hypothetical protein
LTNILENDKANSSARAKKREIIRNGSIAPSTIEDYLETVRMSPAFTQLREAINGQKDVNSLDKAKIDFTPEGWNQLRYKRFVSNQCIDPDKKRDYTPKIDFFTRTYSTLIKNSNQSTTLDTYKEIFSPRT